MPDIKTRPHRALDDLCAVLLKLKSPGELKAFLEDLLTPAEAKAISERWAVVLKLDEGLPYRKIYEEIGVSTATVTRVARCLGGGAGGYRKALGRLGRNR